MITLDPAAKLLPGHVSPETAYVVDDYPYGFRLRCKIRYWLETHKRLGVRMVSQTSNPKVAGLVWNKPKASTYCKFAGAMFLNSEDHVQWSGLHEYADGAECKAWRDLYGQAVPEASRETMHRWCNTKIAYDAARQPGDALGVGLAEARRAFKAPVTES